MARPMCPRIGLSAWDLEHDPEKACPGLDPGWVPVFGKGVPPRKRGSCSTNNLKRDDDSKKSHHALGDLGEEVVDHLADLLGPLLDIHACLAYVAGGRARVRGRSNRRFERS